MPRKEQPHSQMVRILMKDPVLVFSTMTVHKAGLVHACLGITSEAGEIATTVKKHIAYDQPLDVENLVEELGDLEFYMEALRQELEITRDEVLEYNMAKLARRYPNFNYSDRLAKQRKDKAKKCKS